MIDSLILGEWELEKVEIVNVLNHINDTNKFVSTYYHDHNLSIYSDSIAIILNPDSRFFRRNKVFKFMISQRIYRKNPVLELQEITLFKTRKGSPYYNFFNNEIITCTDERLVLLNSTYVEEGLAIPSISNLYTYKKPTKSTAIDSLITGVKWYFCSDTNQIFLSENETQPFKFQKVDTNNLTDCPKHEINIEFIQSENSKELACSSSTRKLFVIDGLIYRNSKYRIDTQNKLLYVLNKDVYVYNILLVNENQLTLVLNKSLTDKLNQRMK